VDYADNWVPEADNGGYTMVAWEYYPFDFSGASAWRRSASPGGSPGLWDTASLPVSAGPDLSAGVGNVITLRGELPGATFRATRTVAWSQVSGPGTLTFSAPVALGGTVTADLPGVYRVKLSLTVNGDAYSDEVVFFMADTPAAWLARNPGIGALLDDPDGDGRNNFLEFALQTNPKVADGNQPPAVGTPANRLTLTYQRHKSGSGLSYQVEISDSLSPFRLPNAGELTETILEDTGVSQTVRVADTAPLGTPVRRFLRLRITSP